MKDTASIAMVLLLAMASAARADRVTAMAVAPDGKTLIVASSDRRVRVLSLPDEHALRTIPAIEVPLTIALPPRGKLLAVGGFGFLDLYDLATGKPLAQVHDPLGHLSVNSVAFSPDGKSLLAGGDAGRVKIFAAAALKERLDIKGLTMAVDAVAFAPDGKTVAVAGVDNRVSLFSAADGTPGPVLRAHKTWITALGFIRDGKRMVSTDQDANIVVWDRAAGKPLAELKGDNGYTYALALSPDGKTLAWGAEGGVQLYDLVAKKRLAKLKAGSAVVTALTFLPDGKALVVGDYSGDVRVVDLASNRASTLPN